VSPSLANTQNGNWQDIIVPYVFTPDPTHQQGSSGRQGDRKRADRVIIPVDDPLTSMPVPIAHVAGASTLNNDFPSSRRLSPPPYTAYAGSVDVMPPAFEDRKRVTRTKKGPADPTRSGCPATIPPDANGVLGLGDVVVERLGRPETMSGTGGTGMNAQLPGIQVIRAVVENSDPSSV